MIWLLLSAAVVSLGSCQDVQEVAFTAALTQHLNLTNAEKVKYDTVFTNAGAGFDGSTGVFNCPTSGIYVFQFHTLARMSKSAWLELYHNTMYIASVYGHTSGDYAMAGNSVILEVNKGDQVYVRAVHSSYGAGTEMYGLPDEIYSTFSGYILVPTASELTGIVG